MSEHDDLCESIAVDIGVGEMHSPCSCDKRRIERLRADLAISREAERDLSDAYIRLRRLLNAFDTPTAPTAKQVWDHTESKLAAVLRERDELRRKYGQLEVIEGFMEPPAARAQGGSDE